jgi:superfamily I DNA/RNA helicase
MEAVQYTEEQAAIIGSTAPKLAVNAFAGTGKTSTLEGFAKARDRSRILYLAFNRSVAEEAKTRFPKNVECKTSHGLAFHRFGSRYKDKLGNPRPFHARNALDLNVTGDDALVFSAMALEAVNRFLISGQEKILIQNVPQAAAMAKGFDPQEVLGAANKLWGLMQDENDSSVPMPHDGYLKLYQLSAPDLSKYDYLLLDEAQDTNPCLFSIFSQQRSCGRVLVGDIHQNIYTFRGAMNAMARAGAGVERHALTASFRFGPQVANAATALLKIYKSEPLSLRGFGAGGRIGGVDESLDTAYIFRTNAGLFSKACDLLQDVQKGKLKGLSFVGGVKGYAFDTLQDVWSLMDRNSRSIRDPFVRSFKSFDAFEEYVETVEDQEMRARLKVVKSYTFRIPRLIERMAAMNIEQSEASDKRVAKLTTAHKSKGLEFDQVVMGDDYSPMMEKEAPLAPGFISESSELGALSTEEANLIYVALTRGKENLVASKGLADFIQWHKKEFD